MKSNRHPKVAILVGCALSFAAGSLTGQDWPQWRGPNRDAKAPGFKPPASWPKELKRIWSVPIGDGVATPALVGNRLYTFSREDANEVVRCLDAATGKELWQDKHEALAPTGGAARFPGPRSSPTVAAGKVLAYGVRGTLTCYDAESGKVLWRKEGTSGGWPTFFTSSSPLVLDGMCIAQLGSDKEGSISALDLATGEEKWKWTGDGTAYGSPAVMQLGGSKLIVAVSATRVVALDAGTGKQLWETPFAGQGMGNHNTVTPIIDGDTIIYLGSRRGATAVQLARQGETVTGSQVWINPDQSIQFNTPVLSRGLVVGVGQTGELFALDAKTGKTAWTAVISKDQPPGGGGPGRGPGGPPGAGPGPEGRGRGGRGPGGPGGFGSVVEAGPVLVALTPASELIVFEPNPAKYVEVARIKVADSPTHAYPVLSGNRIFIKDQNSVSLLQIE